MLFQFIDDLEKENPKLLWDLEIGLKNHWTSPRDQMLTLTSFGYRGQDRKFFFVQISVNEALTRNKFLINCLIVSTTQTIKLSFPVATLGSRCCWNINFTAILWDEKILSLVIISFFRERVVYTRTFNSFFLRLWNLQTPPISFPVFIWVLGFMFLFKNHKPPRQEKQTRQSLFIYEKFNANCMHLCESVIRMMGVKLSFPFISFLVLLVSHQGFLNTFLLCIEIWTNIKSLQLISMQSCDDVATMSS